MNGSANIRRDGVIPQAGLTVLFNPHKPSLDIVFIHGFTGHPERTWTHKRGDVRHRNEDNNNNDELVEPPSKVRKLNLFSRSHHGGNSNTAVYWPRDLVPVTIPYARVLTYGYDTHLRHYFGSPVSRNTVYDIAWDFLVSLEAERRLEPSRPVLFIAHSLGGIILKEMLRRSSGCHVGQTHLHSVFDSTIGIMFFGTPHGGADPRGFIQHIAEAVIKAAGVRVNEQIVNTLLPSAERLRELRDEFNPMAHQQYWMIHSFQEELGVMGLNGHKVVEDASSYLNIPSIEVSQHIRQNHMDMCRFTGPDDIEYKKVAAALHRMTSMVSKQSRRAETPCLNEEQRRTLVDSMMFDQIDARQMTIKRAHAKTCEWLLKKSEYLDWLDASKLHEHHGFLWINGKPGAGKSTMVKFALSNSRKIMKDQIIISFFFNARGADLEKSTIGMYRSLLVQLLKRLPELQCVFESVGFTTWNSSGHLQWSVELLKELFQQAVQRLGQFSVMCFIDALDECDEYQIRDMVTCFQRLGELTVSAGIRFQVCFSSRHYPHIRIEKGLSLVLETQEGHIQDIISYISNELKIGHSKLAEQIRAELQEKASGVFMWVVLVVDMLNKEHDEGRTTRRLQQKLKDIPSDLHKLFRNILTRDCRNRDELLLCIQWLLFARQPLKPEQLHCAILSSTEPENLSEWDSNEMSIDAIKRFILNSSKGLAEITTSKTPSVQFIHESVKDFLLKENGLRAVWSDLGSNFQGQSHERLKQVCHNYMSIDIATHLNIGASLPKASSQEAADLRQSAVKAFPFLQYAIQNILYHADIAERNGVSQKDFVQSFQLANWINLNNLFERHEIRRHPPNTSLLYILAEGNIPNLIRVHSSNLSCFEVENVRYGLPFFAALATGSDEAIRAFLEAQAEIQPPTSPLHDLCKQYFQDGKKQAKIGRDFTFSRQRGVLSYIAEHGDDILLNFLLERGAELETKSSNGRTPLSWAAESGREAAVRLLLEKGAELETTDNSGRTPLYWTASNGHEAVARLLVEQGADIEAKDTDAVTALHRAASNGHEAVARLLVEEGADIEAKDMNGCTALHCAARNGHEVVVQVLVEKGADVEAKDRDEWTALHRVARSGLEGVVQVLVEKGADVEAKNKSEWTALYCAARNGHKVVVQQLIKKGADVRAKDRNGCTALYWAAMNGHVAVVRLLVEKGADVEAKDKNEWTALHHVAVDGLERVVQVLVEKGADIEAKNKDEWTALYCAARNGHEVVVQLLIKKGADVRTKDINGCTALYRAASNGHEAVVQLLVEQGADIEAKDTDKVTALHQAASNGHEMVVQLLVKKGADIRAKDKNGRTALHYAASKGHEMIVWVLLEKGADIEVKDIDGWTAIYWAASNGHEIVVQLLVKQGADIEAKDTDKVTMLHRVALNGHEAVVRLLVKKGVDVRVKDINGWTALYRAVSNGHEVVSRLLLENGAGPLPEKSDGDPLWRKDIQYDFLKIIFEDDTVCFTNSYEPDNINKQSFANLYIDTMARSSNMSKKLRDKFLSECELAKNIAMLCLLVNLGHMNTALNFFPKMQAQLRTCHAIPSLQAHQDLNSYKQFQDAPQLKSMLKGASKDRPEPNSLGQIEIEEIPRTNPINLIFVLSQFALKVTKLHFPHPRDFYDLFMRTSISSASRARAFLWLMWFYLESDFTEKGAEENPFGAGVDYHVNVKNQGVPRFDYLTKAQQEQENIDTQEEIEYGHAKMQERKHIIEADKAILLNRTHSI